jgi:hypothetical protein
MAVTRSKSYAPELLPGLTHHRRHTKRYAAKLLAKREAEATKRYEENRVIAERYQKERDEAIGKEELEKRKAEVARIQKESSEKIKKMAEFLKALKEKKGAGSRKNTKRSKKTKRRSARK